ncbi:MAG TPA: NlpC/P60 family protein [Acidimicrobiales bacterium]
MSSLPARALAVLVLLGFAAFATAVAVVGGALTSSATSGAVTGLEQAAQACAVFGGVGVLSSEQAQNAEVVVATALANSAENLLTAQIAVMAAYTESGLRNLGPDAGRADSLGLFQQRMSQGWGSASQEMDPAQATVMFVRRLVAVPGFSSIAPWDAAERVQRSVFQDASNYEANWSKAVAVVSVVESNGSSEGGCGQGVPGGLAGPAPSHGLPPGYAIPAGTPPAHAAAVAFALGQLGKPYVWGSAGPGSFDCSGLTAAAWAAAGVGLLHYTVDQLHEGQMVVPGLATPGDLVLIPGSDPPGPGLPGHVGLYLGDGLVLSAVDAVTGVAVQSWATFVSGGLEGVVDPAPGR